jgi:4-amino-4-deoxy-L-arabinose transferase-like glycosyltransferase
MKKYILILLAILILSSFFRLASSDRYLVGDEYDWAVGSKNLITMGVPLTHYTCDGTKAYIDQQLPFGILAIAFWIKLIGFSTFAVRLAPIIFGILTVLATYLLAKELFSKKVGLIAAFLMAISRYHISASQTVSNDGSFMTFFMVMTVLSFVLYKKKSNHLYLGLSSIFLMLSVFSKIYGLLIIIPLLVYSYLLEKKKQTVLKEGGILFSGFIVALLLLLIYAISVGSAYFFWAPINYLPRVATESNLYIAPLQEMLIQKAAYVATITWFLTPFLALMLILGILRKIKLKGDNNFYLVSGWFLVIFLFFMIPSGDIQRYFASALPAIFIITATAFEKFDFNKRNIAVLSAIALATFLISKTFIINDLVVFYNPVLFISACIAALILLFPKTRLILLLGAFIGMNIFFIQGMNTWDSIESYSVKNLSDKILERGYLYSQVLAGKDIKLYTTPENQTPVICSFNIDKNFLLKQDFKYIAAYTFKEENKLKEFLPYCKDPYTLYMNDHLIGFVCEKNS